MIEVVLLALFVAKLKGYKLKPLFKDWPVYPVLIVTLIYIVFNVIIFFDIYQFIQYSGLLEKIYIMTFLALILKYQLYKSAVLGSVCVIIGSGLNRLAIWANDGWMPVYPTFSYITGYAKPDSFSKVDDIHILGNSETKLKVLTDYIDLGYSVLSIGDVLIRGFTFIIIYQSIKYVNMPDIKNYGLERK